MCNFSHEKSRGWQGWSKIPTPALSNSKTAWIDLSHALSAKLDRVHFLPEPRFERISSLPEAVANITEIQMVCHFGTHVDAPIHFINDGPAMDEIPLERLYGRGVVLKLKPGPLDVIGPHDLQNSGYNIQHGDIVILDTGWARHMGTSLYEDHPSLSTEAADWLVGKGVKLLAIDFSTPDLTARKRPQGFKFPVHHILLSHGVLIAEHLTNLESLEPGPVDALFLAISIAGSDGAPVRATVRPIGTV